MNENSRIRLPWWVSRRTRWLVIGLAAILLAAACQTLTYRVIQHNRLDTSGRARGVATQDQYTFIADGDDGLKIVNISNPTNLNKTGAVGLPGFAGRIAVEGDLAVVTDTTQSRVHLVDVSDKFNPVLKWTFTTSDIVREVALQGGVAFLAERGDDPLAPAYFSGLEAISCNLTAAPTKLNSTGIKEIRDVAITSSQVFAIDSTGLTVFGRSAKKGFNTTPLAALTISPGEDLQSIDGRAETHLLLLGKSIYLVDVTSASNPVVRDQATVSGYAQNRVVTSTGVLSSGNSGPSSQPRFVRFAYSTLHEYGIGMAELVTQKITFVALGVDLDKESQGRLQLYDIDMRRDFTAFYAAGDVFAVGALDNYGLGVAY
jgi:hypothetical protein